MPFDVKINKEQTIYASFRHEKHAREWAREQSRGDSIQYHIRDRRPPVTKTIATYYRGEDVMARPPIVGLGTPSGRPLGAGDVEARMAELAEQAARDRLQELTDYEKGLATGGRFIDAIRAVRERTGCSLGAAKRSVDIVRDANR